MPIQRAPGKEHKRACDAEADRGRLKKTRWARHSATAVRASGSPAALHRTMAAAPGFAVADDGRGVYVGGLPKHAEWQELKDHMKTAGEIEFCDVLYNDWGEPKGVGYVRYKTEAEAQSAILALNETTMEGRSLKVAPWTGRPPNTNSPGKMMYQMWAWYGGAKKRPKSLDPEKAKLVERIKAYQKGSNEQKETWYSFCGEVKDPARHDTTKLQEFVTNYAVP
ncbi:Polyadenylate-binding protein 3 (AtPabN2) (AtPabN3) (Poly(A)-binding protein 3) (Nuclear poly(A)-binding protein 3) (Poly(A)-binding protein III) (PABIII) [Durusdinium trenchii]|uniref:Polyadenylate-binding protein 3 (AtPabN2) (AtPabN3) (Poly(A)-binding protein 3) (Nuclear poly(A)-binding protein 3) (Poly(A)-binding protein III) (PABIII) n=1 Tax=Durusdinium trenchii TaxID=1381693 RepID=A0ABP0Q4Q2_9DINO